jgi:hypothetical protein
MSSNNSTKNYEKNNSNDLCLEPGLLNTKASIRYLGGSPTLLRRARQAGWLRPVFGEKKGSNNLFRLVDLLSLTERLSVEQLPAEGGAK